LIGGGTGFIGSHLNKFLTLAGYNVTVISRMPGVQRITWHELESKGLPKDTVAVVNLAGQNVLDPTKRWTPGFQQNVWNSRVNSSAGLVRAIQNADQKPEVFVNVSGVSLYRPNENAVYNEDDPGEDYDYMSKLCLEWEKAAKLPECEPTRQVRIRSGVVIGRNGGMIKSMLLPFWFGLGSWIGTGKQPLPWIHIDDLCRLIRFSFENKAVSGALNGVAPQIITNKEFTKTFASVMRRPALMGTPEFTINLVFGKDRAALLTAGAKVNPKRVTELNFKYQYPTAVDACKEVLKKS